MITVTGNKIFLSQITPGTVGSIYEEAAPSLHCVYSRTTNASQIIECLGCEILLAIDVPG